MTEKFWDQGAPYGPNLYSFGYGEYVEGTVSRSIQFRMREGDPCIARGVMLMDDGRVYTWTVLAEGREHRFGGPRRIATRWAVRDGSPEGTFKSVAADLFTFERERMRPDLVDDYAEQVIAL